MNAVAFDFYIVLSIENLFDILYNISMERIHQKGRKSSGSLKGSFFSKNFKQRLDLRIEDSRYST